MLPRQSSDASAAPRLAAVPGKPGTTDLPPAGADRTVIDLATGVVMGRSHCSVAEATEQLVMLGRVTNRCVGEVAQSILDELTWAPPDTPGVRPTRSDVDLPNTRYIHLTRDDLDRSAGPRSAARTRPGTGTNDPNVRGASRGCIG